LRSKTEKFLKHKTSETVSDEVEVIDVSKYQPKKVPSLTWRECIKKNWKDDPLICPECQSEMKILSFITEGGIIRKILKYLDLWEKDTACGPPILPETPDEIVYVPIVDMSWHGYEDPDFLG